MTQRMIANISGLNGDVIDPCPICGMAGCVHTVNSDDDFDSACCEALAEQIANLTAQVAALAIAVVNSGDGAKATTVVRQVCLAGDGQPSLAYDIIPAGASTANEITTIYRPYPVEEGPCVC